MNRTAWNCLAVLLFALGCGGGSVDPDAGLQGDAAWDAAAVDAARVCERIADCDDDLFCNGMETCVDAICGAGTPPCADDEQCLEDSDECVTVDCIGAAADADSDGYDSEHCGGDDCDDADPNRYPGNSEICDPDNHDEDCDPRTFGIRDLDSDGEPDSLCCNGENCGTDCDDTRAGVNPRVPEICGNGLDDDCDSMMDEEVLTDVFVDADGDGWGDSSMPAQACAGASGYSPNGNDCDDAMPAINPSAVELCGNGVDDDCDSMVDEDVVTGVFVDADGDGWGDPSMPAEVCPGDSGYAANGNDCNDTVPAINPGAAEVCGNGLDDDCDSMMDEGLLLDVFADADGDGWGDSSMPAQVCPGASGYSSIGNDCNDAVPAINPGAAEVCGNGLDDNCDSMMDEGLLLDVFVDSDGDGWGDPSVPARVCPGVGGYSPNGTDCDDADSAINPSATEVCGGPDENCNGAMDEAGAIGETVFYQDADGDGHGYHNPSPSTTIMACSVPSGYAETHDDCDDGNPDVHPSASYQDVPFCLGATHLCDRYDPINGWQYFCCTSSGDVVTQDPTWDYDCSGDVDTSGPLVCFWDFGHRCSGGEAPRYDEPASQCGEDVQWATCSATQCKVVNSRIAPLPCR